MRMKLFLLMFRFIILSLNYKWREAIVKRFRDGDLHQGSL